MRKSLSTRFAAFVLVAAMAAPVFAAPAQREDSPIDRIEQRITRIVHQIVKIFVPVPTDSITQPRP